MQKKNKYNLAIVGATGNVGTVIAEILHERNFPVDKVFAVASPKSKGKNISFGEKTINVEAIDDFDFSQVDIALFSPGATVSKIYAPKAAEKGAVVIDNTSCFRMDDQVPLIVPEVNPKELNLYKKKNIIANPNCSTIQMVVVLNLLHQLSKIKRVIVSTYQSVSGAGHQAMDELYNHTKAKLSYTEKEAHIFTKEIAFNVIPHIDVFMDGGETKEEWKMKVETQKILDHNIKLHANCVRVPVFVSHAEAVNVEFEDDVDEQFLKDVKKVLNDAKFVKLVDLDEKGNYKYITPLEVQGTDEVFVSRIRKDTSLSDKAISLWIVADNLRKGAALNAVQIAELLIKN